MGPMYVSIPAFLSSGFEWRRWVCWELQYSQPSVGSHAVDASPRSNLAYFPSNAQMKMSNARPILKCCSNPMLSCTVLGFRAEFKVFWLIVGGRRNFVAEGGPGKPGPLDVAGLDQR